MQSLYLLQPLFDFKHLKKVICLKVLDGSIFGFLMFTSFPTFEVATSGLPKYSVGIFQFPLFAVLVQWNLFFSKTMQKQYTQMRRN